MLGAVAEFGLRTYRVEAKGCIPGEGAEADDASYIREQSELAGGVGETTVTLHGGWFVLRRGAADGGGDPESKEAQAVACSPGDGCVGEAGAMERAEEEVAGAVAGEEAAGAVCSVGGRSEAEDDHAGLWIPESRDRAAPVLLAGVGRLLVASDPLAPLDEARAEPTGDYLLFELRERPEALFISLRLFDRSVFYAP